MTLAQVLEINLAEFKYLSTRVLEKKKAPSILTRDLWSKFKPSMQLSVVLKSGLVTCVMYTSDLYATDLLL